MFWREGWALHDRGYFEDGGVRLDRSLYDDVFSFSDYRFEEPFTPSRPVQPVIDALRSRYPAADYDLIHNNCQCFMDDVRRELQ